LPGRSSLVIDQTPSGAGLASAERSARIVPAPIAKSLLSPRLSRLIRSTHVGLRRGAASFPWSFSGSPSAGSSEGADERIQRVPSKVSRLLAFH
jgi:hypothetical protein